MECCDEDRCMQKGKNVKEAIWILWHRWDDNIEVGELANVLNIKWVKVDQGRVHCVFCKR
jgi:hypothetical protein